MERQFIFNGRSSREFGLFPSGNDTYNAPKKIFSLESIPGRNGELLTSEGYFGNAEVTYHVYLTNHLKERTDAIRDWLYSAQGYCRLEDSWHPEEFRMAFFSGPMEWEAILNKFGQCDITFSCKPQRYLKEGEREITFYTTDELIAGGNMKACIKNPTPYKAYPQIILPSNCYSFQIFSVCNSAGIGSGPYQYTFIDTTDTTTLDSERLIAYDDNGIVTNKLRSAKERGITSTDAVTYTGTPFPVLLPGNNYFTYSQRDSVKRTVTIIPNFYRI